ncbi:MAG: hypothetical protein AAF961_10095, partial [Planctomycetota bacterium]
GFRSSIGVNHAQSDFTVRGEIDASHLNHPIRSGDLSHATSFELQSTDHKALSEALFPDARMPYLYVGRRWREESYNPFRSPSAPVEVVEAEVVSVESVEYCGEARRAMRVEFKCPQCPGVPPEGRLQAIAWVAPEDGTVMRQDVIIARSRLRFDRLSPQEAREAADQLLQGGVFQRPVRKASHRSPAA